jgi:hypothetical protein
MDLKIGCDYVDWVHQVQNMFKWQVLVNTLNEYDNAPSCYVILNYQIIFKLSIQS